MSFNVWKFSFNELCDLKNLKKLISGSCPSRIIQSYINKKKIINIWAWSAQNVLWSAYFFVNLFYNIQLLIIFRKWRHLISTSFYTHVCLSHLFFHCFQKLKTKDTLLRRTRRCVGCAFLQNFWMSIFYPADFSLRCFEVVISISKCKF